MNKSISEKIAKLEEQADKLKKSKKLYDAMQKYEDALKLRSSIQQESSEEILSLCKEICILCNILAMSHLQQENF